MFFKNNHIYLAVLVTYLFLFWIPITAEGQYYEIASFNVILNKMVLAVIFGSLLVVSTFHIVRKRVCSDVMFLYCLGSVMVIFNGTALLFTQDMNFILTGFSLLLAPLIYSLKISQLKYIIIFAIIGIALFSTLTFIDFIYSSSLNPIIETRYYYLAEGADSLRIQNNSLFGQKNAFGAIFSLVFLTLLYLDISNLFENERRLFYFLLSSSIILLVSSYSGGGVIVGVLGLLLWISNKTKYGFIVGVVLFLFSLQILFFLGFEEQFTRKILSASVKLARSEAFLSFVFENPSILLVGFNAFNSEPFYTESTVLDMVLNFGFLVPAIFTMYVVKKAIESKRGLLIYLYMSILFLIFSQNSAFLVPSAIIFLVVGSLQRRIYALNYVANFGRGGFR
ncbi:hypothetical protein N9W97_02980 [Pseudomonadales bacterium]|nr:hypothetical protein [Pseudomonadales bacterium]